MRDSCARPGRPHARNSHRRPASATSRSLQACVVQAFGTDRVNGGLDRFVATPRGREPATTCRSAQPRRPI
jgi:hypothetical protein